MPGLTQVSITLVTPNGKIHRLLTRLVVDVLLHPFQPFMLGQKFIAPRMAAQLNIPLVFYGENEAEDTETPLPKTTQPSATGVTLPQKIAVK